VASCSKLCFIVSPSINKQVASGAHLTRKNNKQQKEGCVNQKNILFYFLRLFKHESQRASPFWSVRRGSA
jgi:hypothetical protein